VRALTLRHHDGLLATALAALLVASAFAALSAQAANAGTGCDRVAAPTGSDLASGTEADPLRTAQGLLDSLQPGQTGCLMAGTFSENEQIRVWTPGVTLTSYPGQEATLRGQVRVEATADDAVIAGLTLDGRNAQNRLGPRIYADRVVLRNNDISNGHTTICVHVGSKSLEQPATPAGVVIDGNRIHDCGELPATNLDHGIYVAAARDTVIRNNWIYDNADRGIQLYPDADGSTITGNVIDGNGQGIIFGSDATQSPDDNVIEGNVISNSTIRHNVESHTQGAPHGHGNVVRRNCIYGGARDDGDGGIESPQEGFTATHNLVADPKYVDRSAKNFAFAPDSPCPSFLTDTTAPSVLATAPSDGATEVATAGAVTISFDEAMDRQSAERAFALAPSADPAATVAGSFSWSGDTMTFQPAAPLGAATAYTALLTTDVKDIAGNALGQEQRFGFETAAAPPPVMVTANPGTAVIQAGRLRSGGASALVADDGTLLSVDSTTSGTRTTAWYGRFAGVTPTLANMSITYSGGNSATCSQSVSIHRFTDSKWVTLDSRSVGATRVRIAGLAPATPLGGYVSRSGELRVRVRCTRRSNFYSMGDHMQLTYEVP
jgi:parallel beta-helix repeat protein